ncbi:unnamed protein product [Prorocentrum cordatum]|uniref:P53 and DNA damage-regulated protein 1 n=1 Tax=Prorocentrum cordatum TaxID=2364126 RepID=A0ABN9P8V7_9DINO|nr:unnamed protein product [Polarella glacialis]
MAGGLDRDRLLKIELLADEVLRAQEDLLSLDRHLNGRREALGSFRRGESRGGTQWVATEGQFLRLPSASAREWLSRRQEQTQAEVAQTRQRLKAGTQALLAEHPHATDLPPGVCQLLLRERRRAGAAGEGPPAGEAEAGAAGARRPAAPRPAGSGDRLDYSRFSRIGDSDSDG